MVGAKAQPIQSVIVGKWGFQWGNDREVNFPLESVALPGDTWMKNKVTQPGPTARQSEKTLPPGGTIALGSANAGGGRWPTGPKGFFLCFPAGLPKLLRPVPSLAP